MAVAEAVAEAALFSCHLERNDLESEALLTQIDFRTRNAERRFLIVMRKSVVIRLVRGKSVCLLFELICEGQIIYHCFFGGLRCFKNRAVTIESVLICFIRDVRVPVPRMTNLT